MPAYAQLSGVDVLTASVLLPRNGAWTAELRLDTSTVPSGRVRLTLGSFALVGSVREARLYRGNVHAKLVGGAGGLATSLPAKGYIASPLRVPLQDIATEAGETLSPTCDATVTLYQLRHWMRMAGTAGHALGTLVRDVDGASWRFLPDGALWVGQESWPASSARVEAISFNPLDDNVVFFSNAPGVLPGETLAGRRVAYVEHFVNASRLETRAWFEAA